MSGEMVTEGLAGVRPVRTRVRQPGVWDITFSDTARVVLQVAVLWGFSAGGSALQSALHVPIPGNVLGLCALFAALASRIIRVEWLDRGGGLLTRHLAFFFIPVTVGVAAFGSTFARAGAAIAGALLISTLLGLAAAGLTTQRLIKRR